MKKPNGSKQVCLKLSGLVWALHVPDLIENGKPRRGGRSILDYAPSLKNLDKK